jgi:hypothetical protein
VTCCSAAGHMATHGGSTNRGPLRRTRCRRLCLPHAVVTLVLARTSTVACAVAEVARPEMALACTGLSNSSVRPLLPRAPSSSSDSTDSTKLTSFLA